MSQLGIVQLRHGLFSCLVILLYLNKLKTICFPKEICEYGNYLVTLHPVSRSNVISLKVKLKR